MQNPFDVWGVPTSEIKNKVLEAAVFYTDEMPFVTKDILEKVGEYALVVLIDAHEHYCVVKRFYKRSQKID
jgi:hypothetical protein